MTDMKEGEDRVLNDHDRNSAVSHCVIVSRLPSRGLVVSGEADKRQRAQLAQAHDLLGVDAFAYRLHLAPWKGRGVRLRGEVSATIRQACIATLQPLEAHIEEPVELLMVPDDSRLARPKIVEGEMIVSAEGEDLPETFENGRIDVGALAEEFFALAIPLYPRSEHAPVADEFVPDESDKAENPFAILSRLKPH